MIVFKIHVKIITVYLKYYFKYMYFKILPITAVGSKGQWDVTVVNVNLVAGDRQTTGSEWAVWDDDAQEERLGGQHRALLAEARPCWEADRWTGRGEVAMDEERRGARRRLHQHYRRRAAECRGGRLPGRIYGQVQTGTAAVTWLCAFVASGWPPNESY